MKIGDVSGSLPKFPKSIELNKVGNPSFGQMFSGLVKDINGDQLTSKQMINDFVEGKDVELHEVMIAGEKAKTSLQLLMEIRNKAIDMYKELTRMQ
ncbi:flagellar hook-basal body protein FliE [bacterium BMS3Abin04]|nr:flagellar hook-basal body protein FliE [bacterium BMS3Abin04]